MSLQVAFPPTFGEAQALVQGREDEKRKAAARRDKHKQRPSKSKDGVFDNSFPGAVPGAEANNTAFWLATEVRGTHIMVFLSAGWAFFVPPHALGSSVSCMMVAGLCHDPHGLLRPLHSRSSRLCGQSRRIFRGNGSPLSVAS